MDRVLTGFASAWLGLILLLTLIDVTGMLAQASTPWTGLVKVSATYNPFNLANFLMEGIMVAPAIAALIWHGRRRRQRVGR